MSKDNYCQYIDDFYDRLMRSDKYENIIAQKTIGMFGGTRSSYTIPTSGGFVKVRCNHGYDNLKFNSLDVMFMGSVRGSSNRIFSEGSRFLATQISPVDENGNCDVKTVTSSATIQLPIPIIKK